MARRSVLLLGGLVVVCLIVVAASSLISGQLEPEIANPRGLGALGFGFGPFGGVGFGRFGPFGRHLGGWRGLASAAGAFCFLYLAGVLTLLALPRPLRAVRDAFGRTPGGWLRLSGVGALAALLVLLLAALGIFTFVVFPLPLVLITALVLAAWGGVTGLALALGGGLRRAAGLATSSPLLDFALGLIVVFALGRIPYAGWFGVTVLGALGLGAVVVTRFGTGGQWSLAELNSPNAASEIGVFTRSVEDV
jgi:hypothetical protein